MSGWDAKNSLDKSWTVLECLYQHVTLCNSATMHRREPKNLLYVLDETVPVDGANKRRPERRLAARFLDVAVPVTLSQDPLVLCC